MAPDLPQNFGSYTLHELIARGGMAEIYRATMPGIGGFEKMVAIKKILPHLAADEDFITMLIDEARIIVSIDHYNIAQVYDLGKIDDSYYIAMEYIHGPDLSDIIKTMARQGRTVPVPHAIYIGSCICAGLHVAHSKTDEDGQPLNIVHRDVSPHNVLLSYAGDVKIIDFGVAKATVKQNKTQAGVIKGKLLYMAPEQAKAETVDGRSDLFAAGLIIYKMLTNKLPFAGDNEFEIYNNILTKEITPPRVINPEVPEALNDIVMKLLERDPGDRYQEGYEAKQDFDRVLHQVAPGYTVNRLSRFIDENFANQERAGGGATAGSNPAGAPPQTPSANNVNTGQNTAPVDVASPAADEASDPPPGDQRQKVPSPSGDAGPPPDLPPPSSGQFRASVSTEDTGEFETPQPLDDPRSSTGATSDGLSIPPAALAVIAMALVVAGLIVGILIIDDDASDAAGNELPPSNSGEASKPQQDIDEEVEDEIVEELEFRLDSTPQGAHVHRDGRLHGITPTTLRLSDLDASMDIKVEKDNFEPISFVIDADSDSEVSYELEPIDGEERQEETAAVDAPDGAAPDAQQPDPQPVQPAPDPEPTQPDPTPDPGPQEPLAPTDDDDDDDDSDGIMEIF